MDAYLNLLVTLVFAGLFLMTLVIVLIGMRLDKDAYTKHSDWRDRQTKKDRR